MAIVYKRPRDPNQLAKLVVDIAAGASHDDRVQKDDAAVARGRKGGHKRAQNVTAERRAQIARRASEARWGQRK